MIVDVIPQINGSAVQFIHVDPDYPTRWRQEPYASDIKKLSLKMLKHGMTTEIVVGNKRFRVEGDNVWETEIHPKQLEVEGRKWAKHFGVSTTASDLTEKEVVEAPKPVEWIQCQW